MGDNITLPVGNEKVELNEDISQNNNDNSNNSDNSTNTIEIEKDGATLSYTLDENGNALDAKNAVVYTKDELANLNNDNNSNNNDDAVDDPKIIEIEDEEGNINKFTIDTEGNAINEDNEIIYTKEQLSELDEDDSSSESTLNSIIEKVNIVPKGEDGEPIQYEDTEEGYQKYIEDVFTIGSKEGANAILEDRYKKFPVLKELENHLLVNGSLENFDFDNDTVEIKNDTPESVLINVIKKAYKLKGESDTHIDKLIGFYKADNSLTEFAKESNTYLEDVKAEKSQALQLQRDAKEKAQQDANNKFISDLTTIVNSGKLALNGSELAIPKVLNIKTETGTIKTVSREALIEYATAVKPFEVNGRVMNATQYQMDKFKKQSKNTINDTVFEMISLMTNDDSQIIKSAINKNKSTTIKRRLKVKKNVDLTKNNRKGKLKLKFN